MESLFDVFLLIPHSTRYGTNPERSDIGMVELCWGCRVFVKDLWDFGISQRSSAT
jgi:hypothetical protein